MAEDKVVQQFAQQPGFQVYRGYTIFHQKNSQWLIYIPISGKFLGYANTIELAHQKIDEEIQKYGQALYSNPNAEGGRIYESESDD